MPADGKRMFLYNAARILDLTMCVLLPQRTTGLYLRFVRTILSVVPSGSVTVADIEFM